MRFVPWMLARQSGSCMSVLDVPHASASPVKMLPHAELFLKVKTLPKIEGTSRKRENIWISFMVYSQFIWIKACILILLFLAEITEIAGGNQYRVREQDCAFLKS